MPRKGKANKKSGAPKSRAAPRGGTFAVLAEPQDDVLQGDADETSMGDDGWMAEQRRLLEMYNSRAKASNSDSVDVMPHGGANSASSNVAVDGQSVAADEVIERQRALLDEACGRTSTDLSCATLSHSNHSSGKFARQEDLEEVFTVRRISFHGRKVPTLLQSRDGPCALLAVANSLLLRGTLSLDEDLLLVSADSLISRLVRLCQDMNEHSIAKDANARVGISEVVGRLPLLLRGLLLNCGFSSCTDFEFTVDLGLFDCLGVKLYHVWVAPEICEFAPTFNSLAEQIAVCSELQSELEQRSGTPTPEEQERLDRGSWMRQWLDENRSQATIQGLRELQTRVSNQEVCVLFRNNHFSTVYKPSHDVICALLTDSVFEEEDAAVWESIEVDGSSGHILGPNFRPMAESTSTSAGALSKEANHEDLVAMVVGMGFSRAQAEAGLAVTDGTSAEQVVEAILEAPNGMPQRKTRQCVKGDVHRCSTCGKVFLSQNGMLSHRASKGH